MIPFMQLFLGVALIVSGGEMLLGTGSAIGGLGAFLGLILVLKGARRTIDGLTARDGK